MNERSNRDDERFIVDDVNDDAAAAWRELSGGGESTTTETTEPAPTEAAATGFDASEDGEAAEVAEREARTRDERGRFAGKDGAPKDQTATDQPGDQQQDPAATADAPPPSWGVKAKAAWQNVPADVRQEIAKREGEVAQGLRALADYRDLKPYTDLARQHGTTVKGALDHYVAVDRLFQRDLAGGLAVAAESYMKDRGQLAQTFLQLAQRYGASVPQTQTFQAAGQWNNGQQQPGAQPSEDDALLQILAPVLDPFKREIAELKQFQTSRVEADRNAQVQSLASEIQRFSADPKNIYFANVEADIVRLFSSGMVPHSGNPAADLQAAYDMAVRLHPEIQDALIEKRLADRQVADRQKEQAKADKARQASRSMGGSKMPGLLYKDAEQTGEPDDIEADVARAYRAHAHA